MHLNKKSLAFSGLLLAAIAMTPALVTAQKVPVMGRVVSDPPILDYGDIQVYIPGTGYISRTDRAGNFYIGDVPAGHYKITATTEPSRLSTVGRIRTEMDVRPGMPALLLTLRPITPKVDMVYPRSITPTSGLSFSGSNFGFSEARGCETWIDNMPIAWQNGDPSGFARYDDISDTHFMVRASYFADKVKAAPNTEHRLAVKCYDKYIDLGTVKYTLPDTTRKPRRSSERFG